jgi:hypothetical protein
MQLVLFIPDFVLADEPEVLRACPVKVSAEVCRRLGAAVERCHSVAEAPAVQPLHICADKDATRIGLQAIPEAMAVGFVCAPAVGEVRLEVRSATGGDAQGLEEPVDTIVFTVGTYEGAIAANELREAFLHHKKLPQTTDYTKVRQTGLYGVLIYLRLTVRKVGRFAARKNTSNVVPLPENPSDPVPGVGPENDQFEFAVGLPLYDAAGLVIDLRRYGVLGGIGRDVLKPAAELLKHLLPREPDAPTHNRS